MGISYSKDPDDEMPWVDTRPINSDTLMALEGLDKCKKYSHDEVCICENELKVLSSKISFHSLLEVLRDYSKSKKKITKMGEGVAGVGTTSWDNLEEAISTVVREHVRIHQKCSANHPWQPIETLPKKFKDLPQYVAFIVAEDEINKPRVIVHRRCAVKNCLTHYEGDLTHWAPAVFPELPK